GEWLQQTFAPLRTGPDAPDPGELGALVRCFGLGLVACLVSPHHFHVFWPLPPELFPYGAIGALKSDPLFQPMFISPLDWTFVSTTGLGLNVAGLGLLFLLVLGVVSFVLVRASWRDWRLVV